MPPKRQPPKALPPKTVPPKAAKAGPAKAVIPKAGPAKAVPAKAVPPKAISPWAMLPKAVPSKVEPAKAATGLLINTDQPEPIEKANTGQTAPVPNPSWKFKDEGPDQMKFWGSDWNSQKPWPKLPPTGSQTPQPVSINQSAAATSNNKDKTPDLAKILKPKPTELETVTPNKIRDKPVNTNKQNSEKSENDHIKVAENLKPNTAGPRRSNRDADSYDIENDESLYCDPRPIEEREGPRVLTSDYRESATDRIEDLMAAQKIPRPAFYIIEVPRTKEDDLKSPSVQKFEQLSLIQNIQKQAHQFMLQQKDLLSNALIIDEKHAEEFGLFQAEYDELLAITWDDLQKKTLEEAKATVKRIQALLLGIGGEITKLEHIVMKDAFLASRNMAKMLAQSREETRKKTKKGGPSNQGDA
jgi:hypothetical protein